MSSFFYTLFIYPIESVLNFIYILLFRVFNNNGIVLIGMSFSVTLLSLPLYNIAEKWQNIERETQKKLKKKLSEIKSVFFGDERHMIIQTYYRQNNYHPLYSLRSILGLAIQVPFFIAAYHYISQLDSLTQSKFLFLQDLSKPDNLIHISGFSINILPVIMTLINILSSLVYSEKLTKKDRIQLLIMALLFLILLYPSPSGLVLYWTMNNLFSLVKNILYKVKNPLQFFKRIMLILSGLLFSYSIISFFSTSNSLKKRVVQLLIFGFIFVLLLSLPYLTKFLKRIENFFPELYNNKKIRNNIFGLACLNLFIVIGLFIPLSLLHSSPQEFSEVIGVSNPLILLFSPILQSFSIFIFYLPALYLLFRDKVKFHMTILIFLFLLFATINLFILPGSYGTISTDLIFDSPNKLKINILLFSFLTILIFVFLSFFFIILAKKKLYKLIISIMFILIISLLPLSIKDLIETNKEYDKYLKIKRNNETQIKDVNENSNKIINNNLSDIDPVYKLSKTKQNVLIIMLDRAISSYFVESLKYSPELKKSFSGFTYYPNTVSFYGYTLLATPPIYGGYEYTPININKRISEQLVKKHNEALLVMPRIFKDAGYNVIFTDPTFANYSWSPDVSIFKEYDIRSEVISGKYTDTWLNIHRQELGDTSQSNYNEILKKKLIAYSFFRILPIFTKPFYYDHGDYWTGCNVLNKIKSKLNYSLLHNFSILEFLPKLFQYDSTNNEFIIMTNDTTHEPEMLYGPDFIPGKKSDNNYVDNYLPPFSDEKSLAHFFTNLSAYKKLSIFLDKLKDESVYDNTKIIIVADHGKDIQSPPFMSFSDNTTDVAFYAYFNPLLLVKDFNKKDELSVSNDFMTNADVPTIATSHLGTVKNPFSGKQIDSSPKNDGVIIATGHKTMFNHHEKNLYNFTDSDFIYVKDNIFKKENWIKKK